MTPQAEASFEQAHRSSRDLRMRALQLRLRADLLGRRLHQNRRALADTIDTLRRTVAVAQLSRTPENASPDVPQRSEPPSALSHALANAGLDEVDLGEVVDDLIAAYHAAVAGDDVETQMPLREALVLIGRYLAARVGPRAAGIALN